MSDLTYTITITRWMILRTIPRAYVEACHENDVSPWSPFALWAIATLVWGVVFGGRGE